MSVLSCYVTYTGVEYEGPMSKNSIHFDHFAHHHSTLSKRQAVSVVYIHVVMPSGVVLSVPRIHV